MRRGRKIELLRPQDLAEKVGLSKRRIHALAEEIISQGHGQYLGKYIVFYGSAVKYMEERTDGRLKG